MTQIDQKSLAEAGLLFETPAAEKEFLYTLQYHIEVRIGARITEQFPATVSDLEAAIEYEQDDAAEAWFIENAAECRKIIDAVFAEVQAEVRQWRPRIEGALWPECSLNDPVDTLALPPSDLAVLEGAGIHTVGNLLLTTPNRLKGLASGPRPLHLDLISDVTKGFKQSRIRQAAKQYAKIFQRKECCAEVRKILDAEEKLNRLLPVGSPITHTTYGKGTVVSREGPHIKIRFHRDGVVRPFSLSYARVFEHLRFSGSGVAEAAKEYCSVCADKQAVLEAWWDMMHYLGSYRYFLRTDRNDPDKEPAPDDPDFISYWL